MPINVGIVGAEWETSGLSWSAKDALLYALGVGAGLEDSTQELAFTTENSHGHQQRVLPTFAAVAATLRGVGEGPDLGSFPLEAVLHAEQSVTLFGELPTAATVTGRSTVKAIHDKGRDALIILENVYTGVDLGRPLFATTTGIFVRGEGGFGGERGESTPWNLPSGPPDHVVELQSRPDQALIYRLSGDRNPLHSDPWFADKAGFDRPILHGLCTFGFTGRALLRALCNDEPARFGSMSVRFSSPTYAGHPLRIEMWINGDDVLFRTRDGEHTVLDRGRFRWSGHG
jgi:acyl dehydratase